MVIYCDSVILIYWLDQVGPFHVRAESRIQTLQLGGDQMAVSDLTRLECRVGALSAPRRQLPGDFRSVFCAAGRCLCAFNGGSVRFEPLSCGQTWASRHPMHSIWREPSNSAVDPF